MYKSFLRLLILNVFLISFCVVKAQESETLKVLVIEINPTLSTITNTNLYPNNNGHPKVSEYLGTGRGNAIEAVKTDIEYSSHGYLDVRIVKTEYLDEFPKYKKNVILLDNGKKANQLDESSFIYYAKSEEDDKGDYRKYIQNIKSNMVLDPDNNEHWHSLDYDYLIEKYNLIERRKKGEFDQVWLHTMDPSLSEMFIMVGRNAFYVTSPAYIADVDSFAILNMSLFRADIPLQGFGQAVGTLLRSVFSNSYIEIDAYNGGKCKVYKDDYDIFKVNEYYNSGFLLQESVSINREQYKNLNYYQKFFLTTYANTMNLSSVGSVTYTFNAEKEFDLENEKKVLTNWEEWINYPKIEGDFKLDNSDAWMKGEYSGKDKLEENQQTKYRLHDRWWFYLMPHIEGYTDDGYYNNWWKYIKSLDFVVDITSNTKKQELLVGEKATINYKIKYSSGKTETINKINLNDNNIHITGDSLTVDKGELVAKSVGESKIDIFRDGKKVELLFNVVEKEATNEEVPQDEVPNEEIPSPEVVSTYTFKIIYDSNNGTGEMDSETHSSEEIIVLRKNKFTKDKSAFLGWNLYLEDENGKREPIKNSIGKVLQVEEETKIDDIIVPLGYNLVAVADWSPPTGLVIPLLAAIGLLSFAIAHIIAIKNKKLIVKI